MLISVANGRMRCGFLENVVDKGINPETKNRVNE
jgi:hypothetical protein